MVGAAAMLMPASNTISVASSAGRPNVLMIIADDMNDYGSHGTIPWIKMPYLREFKRTAMTMVYRRIVVLQFYDS